MSSLSLALGARLDQECLLLALPGDILGHICNNYLDDPSKKVSQFVCKRLKNLVNIPPNDEPTWFCRSLAAHGYLNVLKWARLCGAPWDAYLCLAADRAGHHYVANWARENGVVEVYYEGSIETFKQWPMQKNQ